MTTQIYTVGYGRMAPDKIREMAIDLGAVVVDIRFSAWGKPGYKKFELVRLLGEQYTHLPALGNAAYKTGGMRLADYDAGKAFLAELGRPAILMCACADPDGCHRTVVGALLAADGFEVNELNQPASPVAQSQMSLWSNEP